MVLCIIALPVFLFLSLFSAKYRPLARRAIDCVFKKVTLRKCETGLDDELKAASIAGIMKLHAPSATFVNKHFEAFSLIFTILMILSFVFTAQGIYNFAVYGNCNGPEGGFCIYNGLQNPAFLKAPGSLDGITAGNATAKIVVIEFGCYSCPYTKAAEDGVLKMLNDYNDQVYFVFKPFPIPTHPYSMEAAIAASCANEGEKYWPYREALFGNQSYVHDKGDVALLDIAHQLNVSGFDSCYAQKKFASFIAQTQKEGQDCGIYGTPTFFVNGKPFVGQNAVNQTDAEIQKLLGSA
ncbi:MAG: thioredoxin domain-containing protein [Candidatus Micrarchaeota archaeon]|nr:thioredoxin domain-containing protein [Candidatus Micrarchaeota archaeon]